MISFFTIIEFAIIDLAEIEIGGQSIDKQTSEWMNIWKELSTDEWWGINLVNFPELES